MIPLRLELTNFLAYRNPAPLDFTGIHVAVLTGENGAGKSSLLDAITWAVWGRARAKTDTELVHQGQSEMRVVFTFELQGQAYRVTRAKRAGKAAGGVLNFEVADEAGKFRAIGEATIPKTQDKIIRTLRLTYDTFINSAYLMQGQADEFTGKKPAERKQVLADILGLQAWEDYEARAKNRLRKLELDIAGVEAVLAEIETELTRQPEYERELVDTQARALEVSVRLREAEAGWAQIDLARQALLALTRQAEDLSRRIRDAEREAATLAADEGDALARADAAALTRAIATAQAQLNELAAVEQQQAEAVALRQQRAEMAAQLRGQNESAEAEANALKKRQETLNADMALARKRLTEAATAEQNKLRGRSLTLQTATDPRCPTCGQPLTDDARAQLVNDLSAEMDARAAQLLSEIAEVETTQSQSAAELNAEIQARREQYRLNQLQLKKLQEEQIALDKTLAQLGETLRTQPALLRQVADTQAALAQADEAKARAEALAARRAVWEKSLAEDVARRAALDAEAEHYNALLHDAGERQRALDRLRQDDTLLKARVMAAQQKLAALEGEAKQREAKRAQRQQLAEQHGLYSELREAFGKKGVPALMIEAAVPEIEAAANALLARMTGGRMHLRFNTQRETQAGEVRETLDIQIADELGTRAYELYSGGEAFRVNFAVRVALSQLLARRAGTQLRTLIIDEGFGVLDAAGRERLVEAINAAQSDFDRILVVTHIDELKDAFPARIEITKGLNGSEITVV